MDDSRGVYGFRVSNPTRTSSRSIHTLFKLDNSHCSNRRAYNFLNHPLSVHPRFTVDSSRLNGVAKYLPTAVSQTSSFLQCIKEWRRPEALSQPRCLPSSSWSLQPKRRSSNARPAASIFCLPSGCGIPAASEPYHRTGQWTSSGSQQHSLSEHAGLRSYCFTRRLTEWMMVQWGKRSSTAKQMAPRLQVARCRRWCFRRSGFALARLQY